MSAIPTKHELGAAPEQGLRAAGANAEKKSSSTPAMGMLTCDLMSNVLHTLTVTDQAYKAKVSSQLSLSYKPVNNNDGDGDDDDDDDDDETIGHARPATPKNKLA